MKRKVSEYKEDTRVPVKFKVFAYIPGCIIASPAFLDRSLSLMTNRFPHYTVLNAALSAKYSNDMLEALYD